jgi:hypothetical protein
VTIKELIVLERNTPSAIVNVAVSIVLESLLIVLRLIAVRAINFPGLRILFTLKLNAVLLFIEADAIFVIVILFPVELQVYVKLWPVTMQLGFTAI